MSNTQELILIEQRVANDAKSPAVAYLLLIFVGGLGAHRFYLGRIGSGAAQLCLCIFGWLTLAFIIGFLLLAVLGIWLIIDFFLVGGMVQAQKEVSRERLTRDLLLTRGAGEAAPAAITSTP